MTRGVGQSSGRAWRSVAVVLTLGICVGTISAQGAADREVRTAVQQYFKGLATAQAEDMRKAFLPTAHIEGLRNGVFTSWTVDQ